MTKLYGVIGDPIAHSLSPLIHNGWMRDHQLDAQYFALQVAPHALADAIDTLARRGARGVNITLPHKEEALALAQTSTGRASEIGAANTLWRPGDGHWHADNTDAPGFLASLSPHLSRPIKGQTALVLGAGGSARAVVHALHTEGASVIVANRTLARAEALLAGYNELARSRRHMALPFKTGLNQIKSADFVINTTSLGHADTGIDLGPGHGRLFYDLSYGKPAKAIAAAAISSGWRAENGMQMLVYQAAFAFERWFGIMPDIATAIERVRRTLEATS